jgi:hypothetical protein
VSFARNQIRRRESRIDEWELAKGVADDYCFPWIILCSAKAICKYEYEENEETVGNGEG